MEINHSAPPESSLKPIIKFYLPTYVGIPSLEQLRNLNSSLPEELKVEAIQAEKSTYLKDIDPNLRSVYLSNWIYSLQIKCQCHFSFGHVRIYPFGKIDIDFFADGVAVIVLTVFADSSSPINPRDIHNVLTMIVSWIDHQDPRIVGLLSALITKIRSSSEPDTDFLNVAKNVEMSHGSLYGGSFSIIDGFNLEENDKNLLFQFLVPDYTEARRTPKHINTDEFLAERMGDMVLHASWEGLVAHGRIYWPDIIFYDIINRLVHHIWTACYYLDQLASYYLSQQAYSKELNQDPYKSQYKAHARAEQIKKLRAFFFVIRDTMNNFDSRLNIRIINLLKVSAAYGNLDRMLPATDEKINFLMDEYVEQSREYEHLQSELFNRRLQFLALLIGTLVVIDTVNILLGEILMPGDVTSRILNVAARLIPVIIVDALIYWFGLRKRHASF